MTLVTRRGAGASDEEEEEADEDEEAGSALRLFGAPLSELGELRLGGIDLSISKEQRQSSLDTHRVAREREEKTIFDKFANPSVCEGGGGVTRKQYFVTRRF